MEDPIGKTVCNEHLVNFLDDFRRALLMQRKARLNLIYYLMLPESGRLLFGEDDDPARLDFREWLRDEPSEEVAASKHYLRLLAAQKRLIESARVVMAAAGNGTTEEERVAEFFYSINAFEQAAERLSSGVTAAMVDIDELTGLLNRHAMQRDLARIHAHACSAGKPFALAMVDADLFKLVNDRYGHAFGDLVLEVLAQRFEESVRPRDRIYRYGGEEFLVVLPETSTEQALLVLERLRHRASGKPISDGAAEVSVSVSLGLVEVLPNGLEVDAALQQADAALYLAKQNGRDRIELAPTGF